MALDPPPLEVAGRHHIHTMMKPRYIALISLALLCTSCVWLRLLTFKNQLKTFDKHFTLTTHADDSYAMHCKSPTLLTDDIRYVTFDPSEAHALPSKKINWHYTFEKVHAPKEGVMDVTLHFNAQKKLTDIHFPTPFAKLIPPTEYRTIIDSIAHAQILKRQRSVIARAQHSASNPLTKTQIDTHLGTPLSSKTLANGTSEYFYRYQLRSSNPTKKFVWARIFFNKNNLITKMQSHLAGGVITVVFD